MGSHFVAQGWAAKWAAVGLSRDMEPVPVDRGDLVELVAEMEDQPVPFRDLHDRTRDHPVVRIPVRDVAEPNIADRTSVWPNCDTRYECDSKLKGLAIFTNGNIHDERFCNN